MVSGETETELETAAPVPIVYRANPGGNAGEQAIDKGWIWFTVTNSVAPTNSSRVLRKIRWNP